MMKLPPKVSRGQEVRADDYNALLDFVRSLVMQTGPGYRVSRGPAGQTLAISRPVSESVAVAYASCLTPKEFIIDADLLEDVKLVLNPCEMFAAGPEDGGVMQPILVGATPLTNDPPPKIDLAEGENTLWAEWDTDGNGTVDDDSVLLSTTEPTGTQAHLPAGPGNSAQAGKYKQKIAIITVTTPSGATSGKSRSVEWVPISPGMFWNTQDRDLASVGTGAKVAKEVTATGIKFRSIDAKAESVTGGTQFTLELAVEEKTDIVEISGTVDVTGATGVLQYEMCDESLVTFATVTNGLITNIASAVPVGECDTDTPGP